MPDREIYESYDFIHTWDIKLEESLTTVWIPIYLYNISIGDEVITYNACAIQVFFTDLCEVTEYFLLAAMSYDRYVAICKPLHYVTVMSSRVCQILTIDCWMAALCMMIPPLSLGLLVTLKFCDSNMNDHFACDAVPLVEISCSETLNSDNLCCTDPDNDSYLCHKVICFHYQDNFEIPFCSAKEKACSSHIIVVSITYGTCMFIYMNPTAKEQVTINKVISLLISAISPLLNLFIYTLRNKQAKKVFNNSIKIIASFLRKQNKLALINLK